jgi:hypothetical protein
LSGGTAGSTVAVWRVIAPVAAGSLITFNTLATIFNVAGVTAGASADATIDLATSTNLTIGTASNSLNTSQQPLPPAPPVNGNMFTGVNLVSVVPGIGNINVPTTANVATQYKKWTTGGPLFTATAGAAITATSNTAAGSVPNQVINANKLVYKLVGDFSGVTSIAGVGATSAIVGSSATGVPSVPPVAAGFTINAAKTEAYASNAVAIAAGATTGVTGIVVTIDGTSVQPSQVIMLSTDLVADTLYAAHETTSVTPVHTITRNGTFFTTNSTGGLNNIKVTDMSGLLPTEGGEISVMAWDASGAAVPAAAGAAALPTVPSNGTVVLPGTMLTGNYPTAVRFDVTVNSSRAVISNVKKTADGTTITTLGNGAVPL